MGSSIGKPTGGGGSPTWGDILGALANQTDLQDVLNLKLDIADFVSGGSDTQVQFNDSGSFGGDAGLTYNKITGILSVEEINNISADLVLKTLNDSATAKDIRLLGGTSSAGGGANIFLYGGDGGTTAGLSPAGGIEIRGGNSNATGNNGGDIFFEGGNGPVDGSAGAGGTNFYGGVSYATNYFLGGNLSNFAGTNGANGAVNGFFYAQGGDATFDGNGGDVWFSGGKGMGMGYSDGHVLIGQPLFGFKMALDVDSLTSDRTVSFPDNSGMVAFLGDDISNFNNDSGYITAIAGESHNSLSDLTVGDVHTQYALLEPGTSSRNVIQPSAANAIGLIVRGHASQSVDIAEIQTGGSRKAFYVSSDGDTHIGTTSDTSSGTPQNESYKFYFDRQFFNGSVATDRSAYIYARKYQDGAQETILDFVLGGSSRLQLGDPSGTVIFPTGLRSGTSSSVLIQGASWRTTDSSPFQMRGEANYINLQGEKNTAGDYDIRLIGQSSAGASTASNIVGFYNYTALKAKIDKDGNISTEAAGAGIRIKEGTNSCMGTATLAAGTVTVNTTKVTANSRIFLTVQGGTLTNVGSPYVSARTPGTSFTINSVNTLDASDIAWIIVEPS